MAHQYPWASIAPLTPNRGLSLGSSSVALLMVLCWAGSAIATEPLAPQTPENAAPEREAPEREAPEREALDSGVSALALPAVRVRAPGETPATDGYHVVSTSTATRTPQSLLDIPQSVTVISAQALKDQGAQSLDDALAMVSGVTQTNTLGGTQDAIIRRGFGENRDGSILINGLKTALPRSYTLMTDRVEVLKGPASTLYGILDPGGMINVITKKPQQTMGGEVYGSLSSFGGGSSGFGVTGPIEGTEFSVRVDGFYENRTYWRNFGEIDRVQIAPAVRWQGDQSEVTVTYFHEKYSVPFDRGTVFDVTTGEAVGTNREIRFDEPYNVSAGTSDMVQLEANHHLSETWAIGVNYAYSVNEYADNQARLRSYNPTTGLLTRRADATQNSTVTQHAGRVDLTGKAQAAGFDHDLLFGASYDQSDTLRTDMIRCSNVRNFNVNSPVYGVLAPCVAVSASDSDQTEKLSTVSGYAQDTVHLTESWLLTGGLRYQYYDLLAGKGRPFVTNTDSAGHALIPNGGLVYRMTPDVSLYGSVAKSFRPQSSVGSYIGDIPPETGISYETGFKMDVAERLNATVAFYHATKQNVAYSETVGGETVVKAAGEVRSRGIEVDLTGALTDSLDLMLSYGLTDARIMKDPDHAGNRPANVARHTGAAYLTYDFGAVVSGVSEVKIGGGARAASKRAGATDNSYFLPAYVVADAYASTTLDLQTPITLQLNLKNLFDRTYYTSSIGTNALSNLIGEPFNATLTLRAAF